MTDCGERLGLSGCVVGMSWVMNFRRPGMGRFLGMLGGLIGGLDEVVGWGLLGRQGLTQSFSFDYVRLEWCMDWIH